MKIQNVAKFTLSTLLALQLLNAQAATTKALDKPSKKFITVLKTKNREDLKDPYFQLKAVRVRQLTDEEALEFDDTDDSINIENKSFVGPNIPNIPKIPNIPPVPPAVTPAAPTTPASSSTTSTNTTATPGTDPVSTGIFDSVIMVVDKLIAVGQKILPAIKEGRAVVTNNSMAAVSVLPRSVAQDPVLHDMGGWSIPVTKHYKISYENGLGSEVISFVYSVSFQYGGSVDGKGKYLAGIRASARNITISWGFDLDASSQLIQISNVGTQKDVIAGATLEMTYTVKNWTKTITNSVSFHVTGDGRLFKLD